MRLTLTEICAALEMDVPAGVRWRDSVLGGACTDNREVRPDDVFVCIKGEKVDGHDYAGKAVEAGAGLVVAERALPQITTAPVLVVPDSVKALGRIAHAWRERFKGTLVVVTGSAGKTTVKEVLAHVLGQHALTAKNELNKNNQIGMPISLCRTSGEEAFWVMEAGISHAHDMDELGQILCPDVALVLNVGGAHAEGLGDKGVAWHKAHLLAYVREKNAQGAPGLGFACADYDDLAHEARKSFPNVQLFSGVEEGAPLWASSNGSSHAGKGLYTLHLGQRELHIEAPFRGSYGAENAIAIASVAAALGLPDAEIAQGFATAHLPRQRFEVRRAGAWTIVDDCYNANPLSMRRMLESVQELAQGKALVAVMGSMGELGSTAINEHHLLGRRLAEAQAAVVYWRGDFAWEVEQGLREAGSTAPFRVVPTTAEFAACWQERQGSGGVVLCKGSRSNHLEEFVQIMCGCKEDGHVL